LPTALSEAVAAQDFEIMVRHAPKFVEGSVLMRPRSPPGDHRHQRENVEAIDTVTTICKH
jgi:hypothetical protein